MSQIFSTLCCISIALFGVNGWNYKNEGPDRWGVKYSACNGNFQSPINIPKKMPAECTAPGSSTRGPLLNLNWRYNPAEMTYKVENNGHTMVLTPARKSKRNTLELLNTNKNRVGILKNIWFDTYKSPENKEYCLDSLHFHWGATDNIGSEHTFNGNSSAFEAHFLHYSCDFESLGDALAAYNAGRVEDQYVLSAIGILFDVGGANPAIANMVKDNIINETQKIGGNDKNKDYKVSHILTSFKISDLLPNSKEFISYYGSITAPPCNETVRWNVMNERLTISKEQLNQFRKLLESDQPNDYMVNNYRPVQNNPNNIAFCQAQIDSLYVDQSDKKKPDTVLIVILVIAGVIILCCGCKYMRKKKEAEYQPFEDDNKF